MNRIQRFEDLIAWQRARDLTRRVYAVTREAAFSRDFGLVDQMRRAAVSVMSNLAEGFERETIPDRLRFYTIAKGSLSELRSQLYVALDAGYLTQDAFGEMMTGAEELGRIMGGLRRSLSRNIRSTALKQASETESL